MSSKSDDAVDRPLSTQHFGTLVVAFQAASFVVQDDRRSYPDFSNGSRDQRSQVFVNRHFASTCPQNYLTRTA